MKLEQRVKIKDKIHLINGLKSFNLRRFITIFKE